MKNIKVIMKVETPNTELAKAPQVFHGTNTEVTVAPSHVHDKYSHI